MKFNLEPIVHLLSEKLAEDIKIIDISKVNPLAHYFVICTATSPRHGEALAMYLEDFLDEIKQPIHHTEGRQSNGWILVDTGEVLVHIFQPFERQLYSLESLWADQPKLTIN